MKGVLKLDVNIDDKKNTFSIEGELFPEETESSSGKTMLIYTGRTQIPYKGKLVTVQVNMHRKK